MSLTMSERVTARTADMTIVLPNGLATPKPWVSRARSDVPVIIQSELGVGLRVGR